VVRHQEVYLEFHHKFLKIHNFVLM